MIKHGVNATIKMPYLCERCSRGEMEFTGKEFRYLSATHRYQHRCKRCGNVGLLTDMYPKEIPSMQETPMHYEDANTRYFKGRCEELQKENEKLRIDLTEAQENNAELRRENSARKNREDGNYLHKMQDRLEKQRLHELISRIYKTTTGSRYHAVGACCYCQHIEQLIRSYLPENKDAGPQKKVGMFVGDVWIDDLRNAP